MARISDTGGLKSAPVGAADIRIAELAARQHAVVCRRQLIAIGIGDREIAHRVKIRRLHRVHHGVYLVGVGHTTLRGRYMAAALACGPGALLSHRSAATLLDLRPTAAGPIDVTIARGGGRRRRGIAIHTTRSLEAVDLGSADGIPCTSVARTLVDLAEVLSASDLSYALEQAGKQNLFDRNAIDELLTRLPGRRGARKLRRRLAKLDDEPRLLRSKLERKFLELVQRAGLPDPVVNGYVGRHEVDFHWPQQRLIFETDGRLTHANPSAFERDRQRDLELGLAGWTVERVSWTQVTRQSGQVTALLRRRLGIPPP